MCSHIADVEYREGIRREHGFIGSLLHNDSQRHISFDDYASEMTND